MPAHRQRTHGTGPATLDVPFRRYVHALVAVSLAHLALGGGAGVAVGARAATLPAPAAVAGPSARGLFAAAGFDASLSPVALVGHLVDAVASAAQGQASTTQAGDSAVEWQRKQAQRGQQQHAGDWWWPQRQGQEAGRVEATFGPLDGARRGGADDEDIETPFEPTGAAPGGSQLGLLGLLGGDDDEMGAWPGARLPDHLAASDGAPRLAPGRGRGATGGGPILVKRQSSDGTAHVVSVTVTGTPGEVVAMTANATAAEPAAAADAAAGASTSVASRWGQTAAYMAQEGMVVFVGGQIDDASSSGNSNSPRFTNDVLALNLTSARRATAAAGGAPRSGIDSSSSVWTRLVSPTLPSQAYAAQVVTQDAAAAAAAAATPASMWLVGGSTPNCTEAGSSGAASIVRWQPATGARGIDSVAGSWSSPSISPDSTTALPARRRGAKAMQVPVDMGLSGRPALLAQAAGGVSFMVVGGVADATTCAAPDATNVGAPYPGVDVWTLSNGTLGVRSLAIEARLAAAGLPLVDYALVGVSTATNATRGASSDRVLFLGGTDANDALASMTSLWSLDLPTGQWHQINATGARGDVDVPVGRVGHIAQALPDGRVVLHGGFPGVRSLAVSQGRAPSSDAFVLRVDLANGNATWSRIEASGRAPARGYHSAVALDDGAVMLAFGKHAASNPAAAAQRHAAGRGFQTVHTDARSAVAAADDNAADVHFLTQAADGTWRWSTMQLASAVALQPSASPASSSSATAAADSAAPLSAQAALSPSGPATAVAAPSPTAPLAVSASEVAASPAVPTVSQAKAASQTAAPSQTAATSQAVAAPSAAASSSAAAAASATPILPPTPSASASAPELQPSGVASASVAQASAPASAAAPASSQAPAPSANAPAASESGDAATPPSSASAGAVAAQASSAAAQGSSAAMPSLPVVTPVATPVATPIKNTKPTTASGASASGSAAPSATAGQVGAATQPGATKPGAIAGGLLGAAALAATLGGLYAAHRRRRAAADAHAAADDESLLRSGARYSDMQDRGPPVSSLWLSQPAAWASAAGRSLKRSATSTRSRPDRPSKALVAERAQRQAAAFADPFGDTEAGGDGARYTAPDSQSFQVLRNVPRRGRRSLRRGVAPAAVRDQRGDALEVRGGGGGGFGGIGPQALPESFISALVSDDDDNRFASHGVRRNSGFDLRGMPNASFAAAAAAAAGRDGRQGLAPPLHPHAIGRAPSSESLESVGNLSHLSYPFLAGMHRPSLAQLASPSPPSPGRSLPTATTPSSSLDGSGFTFGAASPAASAASTADTARRAGGDETETSPRAVMLRSLAARASLPSSSAAVAAVAAGAAAARQAVTSPFAVFARSPVSPDGGCIPEEEDVVNGDGDEEAGMYDDAEDGDSEAGCAAIAAAAVTYAESEAGDTCVAHADSPMVPQGAATRPSSFAAAASGPPLAMPARAKLMPLPCAAEAQQPAASAPLRSATSEASAQQERRLLEARLRSSRRARRSQLRVTNAASAAASSSSSSSDRDGRD